MKEYRINESTFTRHAIASSVTLTISGVDYSEHDLGEKCSASLATESKLPSIMIDFLTSYEVITDERENQRTEPSSHDNYAIASMIAQACGLMDDNHHSIT